MTSLGLVDDILVISEPGFKANVVNSVLNISAANKTLQFSDTKCKQMYVGKKGDRDELTGTLTVDSWETRYESDKEK